MTDHLVRWLEWLACIWFWWNPVAFWARHNLRMQEGVCCDALVLQLLEPDSRTYANSLLTVVEYLAPQVLRPPAMASEINSGGFLERRLKMIICARPIPRTPRWLHGGIVLLAVALMPLGLAQAQAPDYQAVGTRLKAAVKAGELSPAQAKAMLGALRTASGDQPAVGTRLRAAVEAGEVTAEQARAMMRALRQGASRAQPAGDRASLRERLGDAARRSGVTKAELQRLRARLRHAVENGDMTMAEARKKFVAVIKERVKKNAADRRGGGGNSDPRDDERRAYSRAAAKLKRAVATGRISAEEARTRLQAMRKDRADPRQRDDKGGVVR